MNRSVTVVPRPEILSILDWTHDGKAIFFAGLAGDRSQIFSVPRQGGASVQLTHDFGNLMHPVFLRTGDGLHVLALGNRSNLASPPVKVR
jgi:Tol biopolymer transport system component